MIRTTILGGALFLLPLIFIAFLLRKAFDISLMIAKPIEKVIPVDRAVGVVLIDLVAIFLILAVCYLAGLLARRRSMSERVNALDQMMLKIVPPYAFVKTMVSSIARAEEQTETLRPVLVRLDDAASIAFEVERRETDVVVYMPGSPSPWSGSTAIVEADRVTPLNVPSHQAAKLLQMLGRGSLDALGQSRPRPSGEETR